MTSDAKVGLLLGLIFIFIIAFIINGLPSFRHQPDSSELTRDMTKPHSAPAGIGTVARKVNRDVITRIEPIKPLTQPNPTGTISEKWENIKKDDIESTPGPASHIVRFETELPKEPAISASTKLDIAPLGIQKTSKPSKSTLASASKPSFSTPKIYIVEEGDSLASIAKKFYGPEQGNKRANVERIFRANSKTLRSADEIYIGQRLIIPPLEQNTASVTSPADVLPSDKFEPVESIGQEHIPTVSQSSTTSSVKYYIVKQGDSLWTIAAEQLGNPNRYHEIARLNRDILEDEDRLVVGMRLKLPAR